MAKKRYEYSTPSIQGVLTLMSEEAKSLVIRTPGLRTPPPFQGVFPALFAIDVVTRNMSKNNPSFDHKAVTAAVESRLSGLEEEFKTELERLETLAKNESVNELAKFTSPIDYSYEITTPQIKRAANLIGALDYMVQLVDTLWLHGVVSQDDANNHKARHTKLLAKAFRNLISTGFAARKKAFEEKTPEAIETQNDIMKVEAEVAAKIAAEEAADADDDDTVEPVEEPAKEAVTA
jgi:hypothetical protein